MEEKKEMRLGPLGHDIYDSVTEIVNQIIENADDIVSANCDIPEGYVHIPRNSTEDKNNHFNESKDFSDKIKWGLSAALPAALTALASVFSAPTAVVVVLSGAGGVAGSFIQNTANSDDVRLKDLELKEVNLDELTADDIRIYLSVDEKKKQALVDESQRKINALCSEVSAYEMKMNEKHDIALDKAFGEWVQNFLIYADSHPDDRKLGLMRDELITRLARMKIHVYDEVKLREDGKPDVPIQDYLIDSREREEDNYEKVIRPAVYSDQSILARGEII